MYLKVIITIIIIRGFFRIAQVPEDGATILFLKVMI